MYSERLCLWTQPLFCLSNDGIASRAVGLPLAVWNMDKGV